jgi:hypothetical protein
MPAAAAKTPQLITSEDAMRQIPRSPSVLAAVRLIPRVSRISSVSFPSHAHPCIGHGRPRLQDVPQHVPPVSGDRSAGLMG